MKKTFTLLLILLALHSAAQEIAGRILDDKKEPMINATVMVLQGEILKGGNVTDFDGNYVIKPLEPGIYKVLALSLGYDSLIVTDVVVSPNATTALNFNMTMIRSHQLKSMCIITYKKELVNHNEKTQILRHDELRTMPASTVNDIASTGSAVYQQNRGGALNFAGGRTGNTQYQADGVEVVTSGIPANYGQVSGGVVNITPNAILPDESYKRNPENEFKNVKANPVSTMSVDVDRASYSNIRRMITEGRRPPADAVRIEEMVNYFSYDYPKPEGADPIAIKTELVDCPWKEGHKILHIGIQAIKVNKEDLPPSNLVFLIDVSGSMESPERLPLLIESMKLLVLNLRAADKVSIVTYAGNAGLVLPSTSGNQKQKILNALDRLRAGGSTAGGDGIKLAYKIAQDNFIKGGNNRVLLATDGDFNVGASSDNELEDLIVKERETGVYLTCLGVGTDNYKDSKMEMLADKGNGNYDYLDNLMEAQKTLVSEFGGTLFTVAKDVKAQIEFNPARVQGYRLIGYEDRLLNTEDFKDDKKDAGDMGAGHTVTVMYEIIPVGEKSRDVAGVNDLKYQAPAATEATNTDELATIKFRYKKTDGKKSTEMTHIITDKTTEWDEASENTQFASAVAMFGMLLKDSKFKGSSSYSDVIKMANGSMGGDKDGYRTEFVQLVKAASLLEPVTAKR